MREKILKAIALTVCISLYGFADASLIELGNGAIYDSGLNITLTQDVRYDEVDLLSTTAMNSLYGTIVTNSGGSKHVVTQQDIYQILPAGAFRLGGTWWGATAWAGSLSFDGVTGWRLPTAAELESVLQSTEYGAPLTNTSLGSTGSYLFWTSTETSSSTVDQVQLVPVGSPSTYVFDIAKSLDQAGSEFIQVAWAVHDGDIAAVPEPGGLRLAVISMVMFVSIATSLRFPRTVA